MIFLFFSHYFHLKFDENPLLFDGGEIKVIVRKDKPHHDKNYSDSRFSINILWFGSAEDVNVPVIIMATG